MIIQSPVRICVQDGVVADYILFDMGEDAQSLFQTRFGDRYIAIRAGTQCDI